MQIMDAYVTPHLIVPEWARLAHTLLLVASVSPAGPLPDAVEDAFMRNAEPVDHAMWARAHMVMTMRGGIGYSTAMFDLVYAGVSTRHIPSREELTPFLGV